MTSRGVLPSSVAVHESAISPTVQECATDLLLFATLELRVFGAPDTVRKRAQVLRVVDPQNVHAS